MNEISRAILRVKFKRQYGLLANMSSNKARIKKAISNIKGLEFRRLNNPDGDIGIVLICLQSNSEITGKFTNAFTAEGIAVSSLHNKSVPD